MVPKSKDPQNIQRERLPVDGGQVEPKKEGPTDKKTSKTQQRALLGILVIIVLALCSVAVWFILTSEDDSASGTTNSSNTEDRSIEGYVEPDPQEPANIPEAEDGCLINATDFDTTELDAITSKYGEPDYNYESFSIFGYQNSQYSYEGSYQEDDTRVFGGTAWFYTATCSHLDFTWEEAKTALDLVCLDEFEESSWDRVDTQNSLQFELYDAGSWDHIYISCSSEDTLSIAFASKGWDER